MRPLTTPSSGLESDGVVGRLLRHFRGHKNVSRPLRIALGSAEDDPQITCLYDLDIIDPVGFKEVYLYVRLPIRSVVHSLTTRGQEELLEADLHAIVSRELFGARRALTANVCRSGPARCGPSPGSQRCSADECCSRCQMPTSKSVPRRHTPRKC